MGLTSPSLYILVCDRGEMETVEADLSAEMDVQLGSDLRLLEASNLRVEQLFEATLPNGGPRVVLLTMRQWERKLVDWLDRNIVLVTDAGPFLLLAELEIAERVLSVAPNLRNRLADILSIRPDPWVRRVPV